MKPYVIRQGDYLTKLAYTMGFDADDVWNHPKNAALCDLRKDMDVLCPGDILYVPRDERPALPITAGTTNRFTAAVPVTTVNLVLHVEGRALADEPFEVQGLGESISGTTDGEGRLSIPVPVHVPEVHVHLPKRNEVYPILIGHLDSATERSGIRARLTNLGYLRYHHAELDEELLRRALVAFARDHGGDEASEPGEAIELGSSKALKAAHGS
jgi:hypothetical protein